MNPPTDGATQTDERPAAPAAPVSEGWNREEEGAPRRRGLPTLPRFTSPRRPATDTPGPDPTRDPPPGQSGAPGPAGTLSDTPPTGDGSSSRGSTDRDRRRAAAGDVGDEWVDPKDLQAAVRQAADVAFVLVGQGFGSLERRARGLDAVSEKWVPTKAERELVLAPAGRIAKRHVRADQVALDTIDGCMIAAGVGAFAMRGLFDVEPIPAAPAPAPAPSGPSSSGGQNGHGA